MHHRTPAELKAELDAEHAGTPFLVFRVGDGQVVRILPEQGRLTLGREEACDFSSPTTTRSRACTASSSVSAGIGCSPTMGLAQRHVLNGERLHGERALHDGDTIRLGTTHS